MANLIAWGAIVMPLAAVYPFPALHDAYAELARRKAHGKIVLAFDAAIAAPIRPPAIHA
jgi:NADPH:quinone reductase-like Zn-dependent oxidoreductase